MTTEKFTMNERNNELKISLNKKEVILETEDSKIEITGNFRLLKCQ